MREIILTILMTGWIGLSILWEGAPNGAAHSYTYAMIILAFAWISDDTPPEEYLIY